MAEEGDSKGGGSGNPLGLMRMLAGIFRRKTNADIQYIGQSIYECWLIRETNIIIPPQKTWVDSIAYFSSYIHEILDGVRLIKFIKDMQRNGIHPERCPGFLVWFGGELLIQKQKFGLINIGSMTHTAASIGEFESRSNNKHRITGEMLLSEVAMNEMLNREKEIESQNKAEAAQNFTQQPARPVATSG
jgi:hypothetical protein